MTEGHSQSVTAMLPLDVLNEPLFFNRQISQPGWTISLLPKKQKPLSLLQTQLPPTVPSTYPAAAAAFLTPQQKSLMLSAGITKMAHLRLYASVAF